MYWTRLEIAYTVFIVYACRKYYFRMVALIHIELSSNLLTALCRLLWIAILSFSHRPYIHALWAS